MSRIIFFTFEGWAHSHMGRALVAYYEASGNPRVLQALEKVYSNFALVPESVRHEILKLVMWLLRHGLTNNCTKFRISMFPIAKK